MDDEHLRRLAMLQEDGGLDEPTILLIGMVGALRRELDELRQAHDEHHHHNDSGIAYQPW